MINIELSVKNEKVKNILSGFNKAEKLLETDEGYKICSDETSEVIPEIVRTVENNGYKVLQIGSVIPSLEDVTEPICSTLYPLFSTCLLYTSAIE